MAIEIDLDGQVALVTGGTRGVGKRIVERLQAGGATVLTCARRADTPDAAGAADTEVSHLSCDVREPDAVDAMIAGIVESHGRLDIVVNNAGGSPQVETSLASPRFSQAVVSLNLLGPLYIAQAANAIMQAQGSGCIINIGSLSALRPSPGTAAYGAAKAGLLNLTRTLAVEWAPAVRVNLVTVGMVVTDDALEHYGGPDGVARITRSLPAQRMATGGDIGDACLFLASPLASYVSGAHLEVHGGGELPMAQTLVG